MLSPISPWGPLLPLKPGSPRVGFFRVTRRKCGLAGYPQVTHGLPEKHRFFCQIGHFGGKNGPGAHKFGPNTVFRPKMWVLFDVRYLEEKMAPGWLFLAETIVGGSKFMKNKSNPRKKNFSKKYFFRRGRLFLEIFKIGSQILPKSSLEVGKHDFSKSSGQKTGLHPLKRPQKSKKTVFLRQGSFSRPHNSRFRSKLTVNLLLNGSTNAGLKILGLPSPLG